MTKTAETQPVVKNLVITNVTPQDYFPVGSADDQTGQRDPAPPDIAITLDDNDLNESMDLELTIRATPDPTTVVRTLSLTNRAGGAHSFQWDAKDESG
ncbi:MAG: hypothetical protein CO096_20235, partial [Armatimonadetes bacterium CG_4_9_14_3_um_filter_66_14]